MITVNLNDTWVLLNPEGNAVTVKNKSGITVSVVLRTTIDPITDQTLIDENINPDEIGGFNNEISCKDLQYMFARTFYGEASIDVREFGEVDPSTDITSLANALSNLNAIYNEHVRADNPHELTKNDIGLGNIPNAVTDDPDLNRPDSLVSSVATTVLAARHEAHVLDHNNPHDTNKTQVGLDKVENYPPADLTNCKDSSRNNLYMTPATTNAAVKAWVQIASTIGVQTVMAGMLGDIPVGWSNKDMYTPSRLLTKLTDTTFKINSGLQVAFADDGKTRESFVCQDEFELSLGVLPANGLHYVYVNVDSQATITGGGTNMTGYTEAVERGSHVGDYLAIQRNVVFNESDVVIRRVYIGKIYVENNIIVEVVSAPIGTESIIPVTESLTLGDRLLLINPFVAPVNVHAEVFYNNVWGNSHWNDQSGVSADVHPPTPIDHLIVQTGLMGYLSSGRESGCAFGEIFDTVTVAPRIRVVVSKKY